LGGGGKGGEAEVEAEAEAKAGRGSERTLPKTEATRANFVLILILYDSDSALIRICGRVIVVGRWNEEMEMRPNADRVRRRRFRIWVRIW